MKRKTKEKKIKLTWSLGGTMLVAWFLPLVILVVTVIYFINIKLDSQIEQTITAASHKSIELCEMQLEAAVNASRTASYMQNIRSAYYAYKRSEDKSELSAITDFLNQQYKYDDLIVSSMVYLLEDTKSVYYAINTDKLAEGEKNPVHVFNAKAKELIVEESDELGTNIGLMFVDGRLYLYRNLVETVFVPYAMIVLELDTEVLFSGLEGVWGVGNYAVLMNHNVVLDTGVSKKIYGETIPDHGLTKEYIKNENANYYYEVVDVESYDMAYVVEVDRTTVVEELYQAQVLFVIAIIFVVMLFILILYFIHQNVTKPINQLMGVAKQIHDGEYGVQIKKHSVSEEFFYLEDSFNMMSAQLKQQFEKIYLEELALKDANIMILQSQINPHFLNNTLEIINWEARIQGNHKVSGMIEALSVMLSASMNRENKKLIPLSEELQYVEAYFHIIAHRFGTRFQHTMDIDEKYKSILVPRLIIQPIVENVVEHGMYPVKQGELLLQVRGDENTLYIEVRNNKSLSQEDSDRIKKYMNEDVDEKSEGATRLGIRNVNRRLKIIYGEESGLEIISSGEEETLSRLTIHFNN